MQSKSIQDFLPRNPAAFEAAPSRPFLSPPYAEAIFAASEAVLAKLVEGTPFDFRFLSAAMTEAFGGTDAQGFWVGKEAYDAVETALVRFLRRYAPSLGALSAETLRT